MSRNTIKIVCDFLDTEISVSYEKLLISRKNRTFLAQYGDLDDCIVEIKNAFGCDGPFSLVDLRIVKKNGRNVFISEFHPDKFDGIYESYHTIEIDRETSLSTEIELPAERIHKGLICDILNNLSDYLNNRIKNIRKNKPGEIELYTFLYKLNIVPDQNINKICELYFMIKIRKRKRDGKTLGESFLRKLKKFITTKKRNGLISEIAPYLTTRELNYILTDCSEIQEEWFRGKSKKIALKYRALYSKKYDNEPDKKRSINLGPWPLKDYQPEYESHMKMKEDITMDGLDHRNDSHDNLSDREDEIAISSENEKKEMEADNFVIKEEKVVEIYPNTSHNHEKHGNYDEKESTSTEIIKKEDEKPRSPRTQLINPHFETPPRIEDQIMSPFDFKPGWQEAIFSREEVNRIIQERLDKLFIEGDKKISDDDFSDDRSEITLSESLTTLINTSRNRPFLLKVLSLCQDIYGNVKGRVSPDIKKIENDHIDMIKSLNLPERQSNLKFLKMIQSNKNIIKYTRCLEYMNDTPICAFVFDLAVVRGKLSSRQTLKGEKIYKFHPLPGKLHYAIFKQNNLFYISKFTALEFVHIRKQTEIVEKDKEIILRNTQKNDQINFDIFHGNPSIEYGDDTVVLKGEDFKILVEISPTHWQTVHIPKD